MIIQTTSKHILELIEAEKGIQKIEKLIEDNNLELNCEDFLKSLLQIKLSREIK